MCLVGGVLQQDVHTFWNLGCSGEGVGILGVASSLPLPHQAQYQKKAEARGPLNSLMLF